MAGAAAGTPIGLFDSGVGGLSVMREVRRLLPGEDLIYVGDSAYCPYGERPAEVIRQRAFAISRYLTGLGSKLIVVACNTASIVALDDLRAAFSVPFVGMEPAVKPGVAASKRGIVGVLATGVTISGERFTSLLERYAHGVKVLTQPALGLVELVERGEICSRRAEELVESYVRPLVEAGADVIVLGCTHYPFLMPLIRRVAGPHVRLITTGEPVARRVRAVLSEAGILSDRAQGRLWLFTTGDPVKMGPVMAKLLGQPSLQVEGLRLSIT